jgi:DNA-dependent metalloprotease WSS1
MEELAELDLIPYDRTYHKQPSNQGTTSTREKSLLNIPLYQKSPAPPSSPPARSITHKNKATNKRQKYLVKDAKASNSIPTPPSINDSPKAPANPPSNTAQAVPGIIECPICSMDNERLNATCAACAHVLDVRKDVHHWRCASDPCRGSEYVNADDCGVCGTRKDA